MRQFLTARPFAGLVALVGLLAATNHAEAAFVTFNFSGRITTLVDVNDNLNGAVRLGDAFTGTLVYDTTTIDGDTDPNTGRYLYANRFTNTPNVPPIGLFINIGGFTIQTNYAFIFDVFIYDNILTLPGFNADLVQAIQVTSYDGTTRPFGSSGLTFLELVDPTQAVFSSDALPTSLKASDYSIGLFTSLVYDSQGNERIRIEGTLDGLAGTSAVPEPASMAMVGLGLGAVALASRRRRRVA